MLLLSLPVDKFHLTLYSDETCLTSSIENKTFHPYLNKFTSYCQLVMVTNCALTFKSLKIKILSKHFNVCTINQFFFFFLFQVKP